MAEAHDGTGAGLDLFLEWAGRTGEINPSTVNASRSTIGKILDVCDDGDGTDVTRIDVEATLSRFENLHRVKYSAGSLQTYKSRFRQAIAMYKAWLINEPGWKNAGRASSGNGTKSGATPARPRKAASRPERAKADPVALATDAAVHPVTGVRMVAYDMPLRPDLLIRLTLPIDLDENDAARIATFVKSLAFAASPTTRLAMASSGTATMEVG